MHRYELSDRQWARIAFFFPHRTHDGNVGHPFHDPRPLVNGIQRHPRIRSILRVSYVASITYYPGKKVPHPCTY